MSNYTPPDSHNVVFNFTDGTYSPPDSHNVVFNFGDTTNTSQYVSVLGIDSLQTGHVVIVPAIAGIFPVGIYSFIYGGHKLIQSRFVQPIGFDTFGVGTNSVKNKNQNIKPTGFVATAFPLSKIYNLKQILNLNTRGINSAAFGVAFLQGGVKYINQNGFNSLNFPNPSVINTKADQYVNLNTRGIAPPVTSAPKVYPLIIFQKSFVATLFGNALVQFPPRPQGYVATRYGTAWVSHSPRYLNVNGFDSFVEGYPKVFDPTQKIGVTGANTVIAGGVFGDISSG